MKITVDEKQLNRREVLFERKNKIRKLILVISCILMVLFFIIACTSIICEYDDTISLCLYMVAIMFLVVAYVTPMPTNRKPNILKLKRILEQCNNNPRVIWHPRKDIFTIYTYHRNCHGEQEELCVNAYISEDSEEDNSDSEVIAEEDDNGNVKLLLPISKRSFIKKCERAFF